jgi:type IV pilus assembly protein PilA
MAYYVHEYSMAVALATLWRALMTFYNEVCPRGRAQLPQAGFTLIELMIVIAIVAILVALAVPAYQDYTIRAKVSECINMAAIPKVQVSEFWQTMGRWPANANEAGIVTPASSSSSLTEYCTIFYYNNSQGDFAIQVDTAAISSSLAGMTIIPVLSPVLNGPSGNIDWECTYGGTDPDAFKYLPSTCRDDNIF